MNVPRAPRDKGDFDLAGSVSPLLFSPRERPLYLPAGFRAFFMMQIWAKGHKERGLGGKGEKGGGKEVCQRVNDLSERPRNLLWGVRQ